MKKILLFLLVLLITNCDKSLKKDINLIDLVPTNPIFLVKFESTKKANTENFYKNFNLLINHNIDSISKRFLEKPLLISYHDIGKKNIQNIIFSDEKNLKLKHKINDSIKYNGFIIKTRFLNNIRYFSSVKDGIYMEFKSKLLIENSLRNSNHTATEKSGYLKKLYDISNSNITLLISQKFSIYLKNTNLSEIFKSSEFDDWMQYDIEINKNSINLNGVGIIRDSVFKKINVFKNINPSKSNINKIVPLNFKKFERISYNHNEFISAIKNKISINKLKKVINDSLLYDVFEIGSIILGNDSISTFSFENNKFLEKKIKNILDSTFYYRNNKIYKFSQNLFKTKTLVEEYHQLENNYGTIVDDILILSKKKKTVENIILNINNNSTLFKSSKFYKAYNNISEKSNKLSVYNLNNFDSSLFEKLKLKSKEYGFWISNVSVDGNFVYKTQSIEKSEKEINTLGPKIIFNTKINNGIYLKPKWVKNYITKKNELVVQDNENILYLIDNNGEIIWEKKLNSKIIGEIIQVDLYKNKRLQYAFNTEKSLIILDKNGKEIKKIDHKKDVQVLGLSVFDYDKNKNYRFLISYNNKIKMLDSKMNIVRGFNKNNIKHKITNPPKHFRVGSKDYLVFNTEKKLYITDRRGNSRVKIPENLNIFGNEIFMNKNSFFTVDNNNNLIKIDLNGKISKKPLPLKSKYLFSANNDNIVYISENTLSINEKNIQMKYGKYSKPKIFLDDLIQVTNIDENKVYLFKKDGALISYFPIFGSSIADITNDLYSKKMIAVLGDKNEILVYSLD